MSFISELRRRRVFRLAGLYLIGAWLILQIADVTFQPLGLPASSMTALIWIVVAGFFVAVALSWRYDFSDDGLVRITSSAEDARGEAPLTGSDYAIFVAGIVAAGLFAWLVVDHAVDRPESRMRPTPTGNTVAVLPFLNKTGDESLTYFGDGVAEEITNHLSLVDELAVLAFSVSFGYRDPATDPRQVGRDLGVDYVVSGSIRSDGDKLRVSAQLLEAETRIQFWSVDSGIVDRLDAFEVQDVISSGVADAMIDRLNLDVEQVPTLMAGTSDAEAYDLYLQGRSIWFRRGSEDMGRAVDYLAEAVRLDPEFARAWAALASAYLTWPAYSPAGYRTWSEARPAAERALEIDPELAEPYAVIASVVQNQRKWVKAETGFKHALGLDGENSTNHYWYSEHLAKTGRYAESVAHLARTIELDPTYFAPRIDTVFALLMYGETDRAIALFESIWLSGLRAPVMIQAGLIANVIAGRRERADEFITAAPLPEPHKDTLRDFLRVESGEMDAQTLIDRLEANPDARPDYRLLVWFAARVGALDLAMQTFQQALAQGGSIETRVLWGPGHRLVEHPDFVQLLDEVGLIDYWEQTRLGDFCRLDGGALHCATGPEVLPREPLGQLLEALE
ncbi:MAG: hypothetical protein P8X94_00455 [Woeseiaceae bacterium]